MVMFSPQLLRVWNEHDSVRRVRSFAFSHNLGEVVKALGNSLAAHDGRAQVQAIVSGWVEKGPCRWSSSSE